MELPTQEREIVEHALEYLRGRLPAAWELDVVADPDLRVTIGQRTQAKPPLLTEVRMRFKPGDMDALMRSLTRRLRTVGGTSPILVISDYLSPRSRQALVDENINFIDLSGNVRIALEYPGVFIELEGKRREPTPASPASMKGPTAGRLLRFLIDVRPPYGVVEIEGATKMNRGYISRLLESASDEGLISRSKRGPVTDCDWRALIRQRASTVDLFSSNNASMYIAQTSLATIMEKIRGRPIASQLVVTGSAAAYRLDPLVGITALALYSNASLAEVESELGLTSACEGANVAILRPSGNLPFVLAEWRDEVQYVAPSQVAIDCLSGSGRMPAEGESVIEWMTSHEDIWRCRNISDFQFRTSRNYLGA